ncbi:MAG: hypothetical protein ACRC2T_18925 [Thermoguttaceae bacterium]
MSEAFWGIIGGGIVAIITSFLQYKYDSARAERQRKWDLENDERKYQRERANHIYVKKEEAYDKLMEILCTFSESFIAWDEIKRDTTGMVRQELAPKMQAALREAPRLDTLAHLYGNRDIARRYACVNEQIKQLREILRDENHLAKTILEEKWNQINEEIEWLVLHIRQDLGVDPKPEEKGCQNNQ